jgi:hypothetical protein
MTTISDETLGAFLDGELPPDEHAALEARLEHDEELQARMAGLLESDTLLKLAVPLPSNDSMPADLKEAAARLAQPADNVVPLKRRTSLPARAAWPMAMAASIALVFGGFGGAFVQSRLGGETSLAASDPGLIRAGDMLHAALQTTPSGQTYTSAQGGQGVHMLLSFASKSGVPCREFELMADTNVSIGVACAEPEGWRLQVLLAAAPRASASDTYQPASGYNDTALNAVLDSLIEGDALDAAAEKTLIDNNWRRPAE